MRADRAVVVCAWCERVRTRDGTWKDAEALPDDRDTTHGICPDCLAEEARAAGVVLATP